MSNIELLLHNGIKPSLQRMAILDWLREHPVHPTVEDIFAALSPSMPTLSKTTVYNTLKLFSQAGIAKCLNMEEKQHFDGNMQPHAHFICSLCGNIQDIHVLPASAYQLPKAKSCHSEHYLDIKEVEINYHGICDQCQNKTQNN